MLSAIYISKNYFADCDSGKTKTALKQLISKSVSAATRLTDDQFDLDLSSIVEINFNSANSIYTCKANVVVTDLNGNSETDVVAYQVIKRGLSKPQVKIP